MPSSTQYVRPSLFRFLKELDANNEREWFLANKERYQDLVRDPLLAFIMAFEPRLEKISPNLVADPRPVGGSLFRIYRDTRFSKDKRPYKTYAGMSFRNAAGKDAVAPSFYLHLEPGRCFAAGGMWHAPPEGLKQIRDSIVAHPERWKRATRGKNRSLDDGDRLKRAPRGYDAEHPLIEDLKLKGYTVSTSFTQKEATSADFLDRVTLACKRTSPLMEFLSQAVGVKW